MEKVEVDMPPQLVAALDENASENDETRSTAASRLIDDWLSERGASSSPS